MGKPFFWSEMNTRDFERISSDTTIAVLPVASTEQHGPHLPLATDAVIANGMIAELRVQLPHALDILVLPTQEIGKANEHVFGPGTLSWDADLLIRAWTAIGAKVAEAGVRKLAIVNSHGGNADVMSIVARELRVRHSMMVVATQWGRFGVPDDLFTEEERVFGIHGGDVETSLMLHFRADLVRMEEAHNFISAAECIRKNYRHIFPTGPHALAWIAHDLNPHGVMGDASRAEAQKGRLTAEHQVRGFIELLVEMERYPLSALYSC